MINHTKTNNILIFTDLDGTLLDHHSYSFEPALEMLAYLKQNNIPLIIVSSKTAKEVAKIQERLDIQQIAIVENGAGIITAEGETIALGHTYDTIREAFERYSKQILMRGFADMSLDEVAYHTALPLELAEDAKIRTFTEPFLLNDCDELEQLQAMAEEDGLEVIHGGRFYHLITQGQDKANAIAHVVQRYTKDSDMNYTTIALGDGDNDVTMLGSVDVPILIPKPDGRYIDCDISHLIKASDAGPVGWNATLKEYFDVQ